MGCEFVQQICATILEYSPNPINANLCFLDWIDHIWTTDKAYGAIFGPLDL